MHRQVVVRAGVLRRPLRRRHPASRLGSLRGRIAIPAKTRAPRLPKTCLSPRGGLSRITTGNLSTSITRQRRTAGYTPRLATSSAFLIGCSIYKCAIRIILGHRGSRDVYLCITVSLSLRLFVTFFFFFFLSLSSSLFSRTRPAPRFILFWKENTNTQ